MTHRALLTEREREILRGEATVSQNYAHQVRYRVREKIARLGTDVELLVAHQPDLAEELRSTITEALRLD